MKKILLFIVVAMTGIAASAGNNSWTKEAWLAHKKDECEKAGKPYNEAMYAAGFERRDVNKDGIMTIEELRPQSTVPPPAEKK
ncbi:MAG: hypothetical protein HOO88_00480 [Kiritimatiellaceae bacterium]|nr:hypothetical protein [Kiritimatiellaceae bacterium]